jgi:translation initiation factor IF-2
MRMAEIRVHELAKQMGVSSKQLLDRLGTAGIVVPNHFAVLTDADIQKLKDSLTKGRAPKPAPKAPPAQPTMPAAGQAPRPVGQGQRPQAAGQRPAGQRFGAQSSSAPPAAAPPRRVVPIPEKTPIRPVVPGKPGQHLARPAQKPKAAAAAQAAVEEEAAAVAAEAEEPPTPAGEALVSKETVVAAAAEAATEAAPEGAAPEAAPAETKPVEAPKPAAPARPAVAGMPPAGGAYRPGFGQGRNKGGGRGKNKNPSGRPIPRQPTGQVVVKPAVLPREGGHRRGRKTLSMPMGVTVAEFAERTSKPISELIKRLMALGEMLNMNSPMSPEAVTLLADELGFEVKMVAPEEEFVEEAAPEKPEDLKPRAPVVTVMGHVDHGKTKLLDAIRETDVVSSEAGGITQHIGASQIVHEGKPITFIDTPGHEAFTAMRARGAKVTDIAVLVVAADDGVKPQTVEALDHAKAAGVPIVVAVNKIDKPDADPEKVRRELSDLGLVPEEWGGDAVFVDVSAKQKTNINDLLEMIQLVADVGELKANPEGAAQGVVIEAKLDRGRGPVATVLVERGCLKVGDAVIAGLAHGKVRALVDAHGESVESAGPSTPVEVVGLSMAPNAGDELRVMTDERTVRQIAEERALKHRLLATEEARTHVSLDDLFDQIREGQMTELRLVIKADTQGSVEALKDALGKLDQSEVKIVVIHSGVGAISETDVMLADASDAIVVGFSVRPEPKAKAMAEREKVDVRLYTVIYKIVEDINAARVGMLAPEFHEEELARIEVRQTFKVPKIGLIAGCYVADGEVTRDAQARLVREGVVIFDGKIASLRRFKDDAKSVKAGFECGIGLEGYSDLKEGDIIEAYKTVEVAATG